MKEVFPTFSKFLKEDYQKKTEQKKPSPIIATRIFLLFWGIFKFSEILYGLFQKFLDINNIFILNKARTLV